MVAQGAAMMSPGNVTFAFPVAITAPAVPVLPVIVEASAVSLPDLCDYAGGAADAGGAGGAGGGSSTVRHHRPNAWRPTSVSVPSAVIQSRARSSLTTSDGAGPTPVPVLAS
jgi:hypothetical protein